MPSNVLKGQDVELRIVRAGALESTITEIVSFELVLRQEVSEHAFLGEGSNRFSEDFLGYRIRMTLQSGSDDTIVLAKALMDRAINRTVDVKVNITGTLNYPNGDQVRLMLPDVAFGEIPINFGSRTAAMEMTLEGQGGVPRFLS